VVGVFVTFWRRCGSIVGGPWRELQMVDEWALRVYDAELRQGWWKWLEELVMWQ
jgi:hypothetical protein